MSRERRSLLIFVVFLALMCLLGALAVRAQTEISGAMVFKVAPQACASGVACVITYTSEWVDTDNYHDTVANTNRLVAPWEGFYLVESHVNISGSAGGTQRNLAIRRQDGQTLAQQTTFRNSTGTVNLTVSTVVPLGAGDWVETAFQHDAGVSLNINAVGNHSPEFRIAYVGFQYPTPQTFPTFDLTTLATLFPTDTPRPTNTLVPTDTPGWYVPTLTAIPTDTPAPGIDPDPYHTIVTQTLSSGNWWVFDRTVSAGEILVGTLGLSLLAVVVFRAIAKSV